MPLQLDNAQDLWGQALLLKARFAEREAMLLACEKVLSIRKTQWDKERGIVLYEGEKAKLLAQQQAATIRVAVPFKVRLPYYPDHSARDQERLENTELALESFWRATEQDAARQQIRAPQYDLGAYAVETGAVAAMPYFYDDPKRGWRPRLEIYNPRYVYYLSDEQGMTWCAISFSMKEARLAGLVRDRKWVAAYDVSGQMIRTVFHVWTRQDGVVYEAVVGQPLSGEIPENLMPARECPDLKSIPIIYSPAGGPVVRRSLPGQSAENYYDNVYGQAFIAPMLASADTGDFLGRIILRTGFEAASPPRALQLNPDSPQRAPEFVPGETTVVDGQILVVPTVNPGVIPALQAQVQGMEAIIQQVGLPQVTIAGYPFPRSELLRQGLDEAGQQALAPYWACYSNAIEMISEIWRERMYYLYDSGQAKTLTLEITPRGQVTQNPQRESREYEVTDFWPDGSFDVLLRPKRTEDEVVRNAQVYLLLKQALGDAFDEGYWQELLFSIDQPEKMVQRARRQAIYTLLRPETELMALQRSHRVLTGIEGKVAAAGSVRKARLTPEETDLLSSLAVLAGMDGDLEEYEPQDIQDMVTFLLNSVRALRQRVIPSLQPPQQGQGAQPGAGVPPGASPSQGSPAGNGFNGGGGPNDLLANLVRRQNLANDMAVGGMERAG